MATQQGPPNLATHQEQEQQQPPLSLAQFNQTTEPWGSTKLRQGSISTRSSHPPLVLRSHSGACGAPATETPGRRPSVSVSNPNSPFIRRDSVALRKRFSFGGWLQAGGRASFSGLPLLPQHQQPPAQEVHLENTYRTEPESGCHFHAAKVQKLLQATLDSYLDGSSYSQATGSHLSRMLSDAVRAKAKEVSPPRYKLVSQVVVGQNRNQGIRVATRCLWDCQHDDFAVAIFQNHSLFALAMVHGVYCE